MSLRLTLPASGFVAELDTVEEVVAMAKALEGAHNAYLALRDVLRELPKEWVDALLCRDDKSSSSKQKTALHHKDGPPDISLFVRLLHPSSLKMVTALAAHPDGLSTTDLVKMRGGELFGFGPTVKGIYSAARRAGFAPKDVLVVKKDSTATGNSHSFYRLGAGVLKELQQILLPSSGDETGEPVNGKATEELVAV